MADEELDLIHEEEEDGDFWVTHWSDLERQWGSAEEFALATEGLTLPGFPPAFTPEEFATREAPPWLVPDVVPSGLSALFGPTNSGKTFVALDASLNLALGLNWHGSGLSPVAVMYFLAEGQGEVMKRVQAWCLNRGVALADLTGRFWIVPQRLPLGSVSPDGVNMAVVAKRLGIGLIVLDTWARTLEGDENSNADVARTINLVTDIRANSGISVWIVHHTGHSDFGRMRGGSALAAALDCEIRVEGHLQDEDPHVQLHCTKQRDAAYFDSFALGVENWGESISLSQDPRPIPQSDQMPADQVTDLVRVLMLGPQSQDNLKQALGRSWRGIKSELDALLREERAETLEDGRFRLRGD